MKTSLFNPTKTGDWSLVILINFMWATQVPVIRIIGDRMGTVAVVAVGMVRLTADPRMKD